MKKLLEFIWELIGVPITLIVIASLGLLLLIWIFTFFGLIILYDAAGLSTPLWVKWFIVIFDVIVFIIVIAEQIRRAYEKVYKN